MHPLPKPSVDTGYGVRERLVAIKQGVYNNYDTDSIFQTIIQHCAELSGTTYGNPKIWMSHYRSLQITFERSPF